MRDLDLRFLKSVEDAEPLWRELEGHAPLYVFQSRAFLNPWFRTIARGVRGEPFFVEVRQGGVPVALFPFCKFRKKGLLRILGWAGFGTADYSCPIFSPLLSSQEREALCRRVLEHLFALERVDLILLSNNPEKLADGSPNPVCHPDFAALFHRRKEISSPFTPLDSWDGYYAGVKKSIRADSNRQRRRLRELGNLNTEIVTDETEAMATTEVMIGQKIRRYAAMGAKNLFASPFYREFYRESARELLRAGRLHLSRLKLDGKIIAVHWGLIDESRLYYLMPSYDESFQKYSPGRLLMENLIRETCRRNVPVFDFCLGDEFYKKDWAGAEMKVFNLIRHKTGLGRLAGAFLKGYEKQVQEGARCEAS